MNQINGFQILAWERKIGLIKAKKLRSLQNCHSFFLRCSIEISCSENSCLVPWGDIRREKISKNHFQLPHIIFHFFVSVFSFHPLSEEWIKISLAEDFVENVTASSQRWIVSTHHAMLVSILSGYLPDDTVSLYKHTNKWTYPHWCDHNLSSKKAELMKISIQRLGIHGY